MYDETRSPSISLPSADTIRSRLLQLDSESAHLKRLLRVVIRQERDGRTVENTARQMYGRGEVARAG